MSAAALTSNFNSLTFFWLFCFVLFFGFFSLRVAFLGCVLGEITLIFYSSSKLICLGLLWPMSLPFTQGELSN